VNCQEVQTVIDGYVDGELDPIRNQEIEQHLQGCTGCSTVYHGHQALQTAVEASPLYFKSPVTLRRRIQSSLCQAYKAESPVPVLSWRWAGIAASVAIVAILTWRVVPPFHGPAADDLLAQEVIANHVRSLMVSHLVDVPSSDRHTVKPWFSGKLDFSPVIPDLTEHGFPLVGGRLDYLDNRAVAAVVYRRREHIVNLFVWPSKDGSVQQMIPHRHQGYQLFHWTQSGMTYWAVSDLNSRELQEFVQLLQNQAPR
jgi:anti-sigma factor RsiW